MASDFRSHKDDEITQLKAELARLYDMANHGFDSEHHATNEITKLCKKFGIEPAREEDDDE